ncbi:MAG: NosD domain-containing protein [Candidatus Bathyarchaeota archaeon]
MNPKKFIQTIFRGWLPVEAKMPKHWSTNSIGIFIFTSLFFLLILVLGTYSIVAASIIWSQTYDLGGGDVNSLIQTSDGGFILAGTKQIGPDSDGWLTKFDSTGNLQWSQMYGGTGFDYAYSIIETSDGGYAFSGIYDDDGYKDAWLAKTDNMGKLEWNRTIDGEGYDSIYNLVETNDQGFALVGTTKPTQEIGEDFWLIKTNKDGIIEWDKTYGGQDTEICTSFLTTSDEGFILLGYTNSFGKGYSDFWLVKTDKTGEVEWNQTYGRDGEETANCLIATSDGGYAIAGSLRFYVNDPDLLLIKTDGYGTMLWNKTYSWGTTDRGYISSLLETSDGSFVLTGNSLGFSDYDAWIIRTDNMGNLKHYQTIEEKGDDQISSLVEISDTDYVFAGITGKEMDYRRDLWLVKFQESESINNFVLITIFASAIAILLVFIIFFWKNKQSEKLTKRTNNSSFKGKYLKLIAAIALILIVGFGLVFFNYLDNDVRVAVLNVPAEELNIIPDTSIKIEINNQTDFESLPISKSDNILLLTEDVEAEINIETDNIIIDGGNHLLNVTKYQGITIIGRENVTIQNFNINASLGCYVFYIENSSNVFIKNNLIKSGYIGVTIEGTHGKTENNKIIDNTFDSTSGDSIFVMNSSFNLIKNNIITNSGDKPIDIFQGSTNNIIENNQLSKNNFGIWIFQSSSNTISNNVIQESEDGIRLMEAKYNIIQSNVLQKNQIGIVVDAGRGVYVSNNTIYNNSFISNNKQIYSISDAINTWDLQGKGNIWSDYSGEDKNSDGIGDIPYTINENNTDHYPLMN